MSHEDANFVVVENIDRASPSQVFESVQSVVKKGKALRE